MDKRLQSPSQSHSFTFGSFIHLILQSLFKGARAGPESVARALPLAMAILVSFADKHHSKVVSNLVEAQLIDDLQSMKMQHDSL